MPRRTTCLLALLTLLGSLLPMPSQAATFQCSDVPCLLARIAQANLSPAPDTIELAPGIYTLTQPAITSPASFGLPAITSGITIRGPSSQTTLIERDMAAPSFALILVTETGTLTVQGVALRRGGGRDGGGIQTHGTLVLDDVQLYDNFAAGTGGGLAHLRGRTTIRRSMLTDNLAVIAGAGLYVQSGEVTLIGSTIADGYAQHEGGGLANGWFVGDGGTVTVRNSAIIRNETDTLGAAIVNYGQLELVSTTVSQNITFEGLGFSQSAIANAGGTLLLTNTTIADNRTVFSATKRMAALYNNGGAVFLVNTLLAGNSQDCTGPIESWDNNFVGDATGCTITLQSMDRTGDPGMGALIDIGEPGYAHLPLLPTSVAINHGGWWMCPLTDQLGHARQGRCDIGAIEYQGQPGIALAFPGRMVAIGGMRGR